MNDIDINKLSECIVIGKYIYQNNAVIRIRLMNSYINWVDN